MRVRHLLAVIIAAAVALTTFTAVGAGAAEPRSARDASPHRETTNTAPPEALEFTTQLGRDGVETDGLDDLRAAFDDLPERKKKKCTGKGFIYWIKCIVKKLKIRCRPTGPTPVTPNDPAGVKCSGKLP